MEYQRRLEITVVSAKGLKKVKHLSKMDVYVTVKLSGDPKCSGHIEQRTHVAKDCGTSPRWSPTAMNFTVDKALAQVNRLVITFRIMCDRKIRGDKDIGEVHVPVKELLDNLGHHQIGTKCVAYKVRKSSGKPRGEISFMYRFGEKVMEGGGFAAYVALAPYPSVSYPTAAYPSVSYPPAVYQSVSNPPAAHQPASSALAQLLPSVGSFNYGCSPQSLYPRAPTPDTSSVYPTQATWPLPPAGYPTATQSQIPMAGYPTAAQSQSPPAGYPTTLAPSQTPPAGYPTTLDPSQTPPAGYPTMLAPSQAPPAGYPTLTLAPSQTPPAGYPTSTLAPSQTPPAGYPTTLAPSQTPPTGYPAAGPSHNPPAGYPAAPQSEHPPSGYPMAPPSQTPPAGYPTADPSNYPPVGYYAEGQGQGWPPVVQPERKNDEFEIGAAVLGSMLGGLLLGELVNEAYGNGKAADY